MSTSNRSLGQLTFKSSSSSLPFSWLCLHLLAFTSLFIASYSTPASRPASHLISSSSLVRDDSNDKLLSFNEHGDNKINIDLPKQMDEMKEEVKKKTEIVYEEENAFLAMLAGSEANNNQTPDGDLIVEGDIVVPKEKFQAGRYTAINEPVLYWPGAIIPYTYHNSVDRVEKEVIERAMKHWEQHTCVTFRPRESLDYLWIRFRTDSPGCWSLVGRQFLRLGVGQDLSIGKGCAQLHVVAHEIGHAAGFYHEQSRSDRDAAININWENVQTGFENQFSKEDDNNFGVGYDYVSVMQYPAWAFSKDVLEKNTIVTIDPKHQRFLGKNSEGLSFRDKKIANKLYACYKECPNAAAEPCKNEGYLRPYRNNGEPCTCECPPTATGQFCETVLNDDYYEAIEPLVCGGNITTEGFIQTPSYPYRKAPMESCTWNIRAPAGQSIELVFEGFEFTPRNDKPGSKTDGKCYHEAVEIRLDDPFNGQHFCGRDIAPGTRMTSSIPQAIIIIMADDKMIGQGLRAHVRFFDVAATTTTTTPMPVGDMGIWRRIIVGWRRGVECPSAANDPCKNEDHLRPYRNNGEPCTCECPPTATGQFCETVLNDNYYEAIEPLVCGGNITTEGFIQTSNYPYRKAPMASCTWNIQAPAGQSIELVFEGFEFTPRNDKPGSKTDGKCYHEAVEIRLDDPFSGQHFCGRDIA